jgi:hypothetical protein
LKNDDEGVSAEDLQATVERLARLSKQQSLCPHPDRHRWFVRNIATNGEDQVWWRCDDCRINLLGSGHWVPHEYLTDRDVDISRLEVIQDHRRRTPPCRVCGERGAELDHWAPRHLFGADADLWPTDYLCKRGHQPWHQRVEKTAVALMQELKLRLEPVDDQPGLGPRRTRSGYSTNPRCRSERLRRSTSRWSGYRASVLCSADPR